MRELSSNWEQASCRALVTDHFMMQSNGADVLKLPVPELSLLIHRNKIVDKTNNDDQR